MASTYYRDGIVTVEGDDIFYKIRGEGRPVLFIPPAGGNADGYYPVARILAQRYKVICYDRRANTRSTANFPKDFSIAQQSRDALAVLRENGEESALIVGNSSGAVIALDMAGRFPEAVAGAVIHEAPIPSVLPEGEAKKWKTFFEDCHALAQKKGAAWGAMKFYFGIQLPAVRLMVDTLKVTKYMKADPISVDVVEIPSKTATDILIFNELLPITSYEPDFAKLEKSGVRLYFGAGEYGLDRNTWYARVAQILSQRLSGRFVRFPGHHGEYMGKGADKWAAVIEGILTEIYP